MDERYEPPEEAVLEVELLDDDNVFLVIGTYEDSPSKPRLLESRTICVNWHELVAARNLLVAKRAMTPAERAADEEAERLTRETLHEKGAVNA